jgi:hypothetical protein
MRLKNSTAACLVTILILASGAGFATPVTYTVTEGDANLKFTGTPLASEASFMATLGTSTIETFETLLISTPTAPSKVIPTNILGGLGSISFNPTANPTNYITTIATNASGQSTGRFNTTQPPSLVTGTGQWLASVNSFNISLGTAVNSFGMFMTDLGDFGGQLAVDFCTDTTANCNYHLDFSASNTVTGTAANGSLSFLGYSDAASSFNLVSVTITQQSGRGAGSYDVIGFDDVTVGNLATNQAPEPTTLGLTALALALVGYLSRRRT